MLIPRPTLRLLPNAMRTRSSSSSETTTIPTLPRLPVPDLRKTLDKYLTSIEPFLRDTEGSGPAFSLAYELRKKWADEFHTGIGTVLQDRLIALDKASPNNWLDDNFWMNKAYLEWRAPLLINSNWWLAFYDDELIPEKARTIVQTENGMAGATIWQLQRAAWLIYRTLEFKDRLNTQELHPETTRTGIWLRESTSKMFNVARIPQFSCDTLSKSPSKPHSVHARSILVMFHSFCYTIPVYSPTGALALPRDIYRRLRNVVADVSTRLGSGEEAFPIGVLSADDRDSWAKNLQHLLALSPANQSSHEALLTSVMALSLDHTLYTLSPSTLQRHPRSSTQGRLDAHLHSIRTTHMNLSNRFYDKPYTVLVDPLTQAGATGEHSPCDALVPSIVAEYGIVLGVEQAAFAPSEGEVVAGVLDDEDNFSRLNWVTDEKMWQECKESESRCLEIIGDSDDSVFWFQDYGTDWIKGVAQLSPDAYIQMALQLAWYRTRGEFTAVYETVLTRMFKRGRTETLRSYTNESRAWICAMANPITDLRARHALLRKAIQTHARLTREAATGRGIDRHLLGLRLLLKSTEPIPALFADPLFLRSQEWKLSTSGLSAGHWFKGTGFGTSYNDGYGINYLSAPDMIKFGIESKFSSPVTSTYVFKEAVDKALKDMREICLAGLVDIESSLPRSHL